MTYAVGGLFGRRFHAMPPLTVATGQLTASTLVPLPLSAIIDTPWSLPTPSSAIWLAFGGIALFSTDLAYVLYFRALATAGATNLLYITFLLPVSAVGLGVTFLGEVVTRQTLAGLALIGLGLTTLDGKLIGKLLGVWRPPQPSLLVVKSRHAKIAARDVLASSFRKRWIGGKPNCQDQTPSRRVLR